MFDYRDYMILLALAITELVLNIQAVSTSILYCAVFYVPANTVSHALTVLTVKVNGEWQNLIGYVGDGFYRSKDPTNSIKALKEKAVKENNPQNRKKTQITHMHAHTK